MKFFSTMPKWKNYLYNLERRIALFKEINKFGLRLGKGSHNRILTSLLIRFGKGEYLRKPAAFRGLEYVKIVERNPARVTKSEFKLAHKLSYLKQLYLEDIYMEISELKKFAKEVGLEYSIKEIKAMNEEDLIREIVQKVSNKKTYSDEFTEWYMEIPEDSAYFQDPEPEEKPSSKKSKKVEEPEEEPEEINFDEIEEAITDADEVEELYEIIDEYSTVFNKKLKKFDEVEELQEKMIEVLEEKKNPPTKPSAKSKKVEEPEEEPEEIDKEALVDAIMGAENLEELKEIYNNEDVKSFFEGVSIRGKIKFETLKDNMLKALGVSEKPEEEEDQVAKWEAMPIFKLRTLAKEMGIVAKIGVNKTDLIKMMVEKSESEDEESEDEDVVEVDPTLIKSLVKAKDTESLLQICKDMDIKVGSLDKRNVVRLGGLIIAELDKSEEKEPEEKPSSKRIELPKPTTPKSDSLYAAIKEILDKGKDGEFVLKRVKQLINIIENE
jgi:hypothetical protein